MAQYAGLGADDWVMLCSNERQVIIELTRVDKDFEDPGAAFEVHRTELIPEAMWAELCTGPEFEQQGTFSSRREVNHVYEATNKAPLCLRGESTWGDTLD